MTIDLAPRNPYGLTLHTPLVAAAGSLGYGVESARQFGLNGGPGDHGLGALVTRTTTLHPRRAHPLPAIIETPAGLLVSGGAHNPGMSYVVRHCAPIWATWELPVIVSVGGADAAECVAAVAALEGVEGVAGVALDLATLEAPPAEQAARIVAAARAATLLPLLVALPPEAPALVALAEAAVAAGADALALTGGMPGMAADPASGALAPGRLCGPAVRPLALALAAALAPAVAVPLIGGAGIATASDARQFLAAGAAAVSLDTALLVDPRAAARIAAALA